MGNINGNKLINNVKLTVTLPLEKIGMSGASRIRIIDLWNGGEKIKNVSITTNLTFQIKNDRVQGGGLAVLKIETLPFLKHHIQPSDFLAACF
jgi:hypothetical protein